jgi:hypothetical protein
MCLGVAGVYGSRHEAAGLCAVLLAGVGAGLAVSPARLLREMHGAAPGMAAVCAGVFAMLLVPWRSEWVAGGIDPSIYVNEAAALARHRTFEPRDLFFHEQLAPGEQAAFTRTGKGRTERFSGVGVKARGQRLQFEFFRLYPSLLARFCRAGGLEAALRGNLILGFFAMAVLLGLLLQFLAAPAALLATLALLFQPVWLYHTQVTVTEMLQMLLLCATALFFPWRRASAPATAFSALMLLGCALTHFSLVPVGAALVCATAWTDLEREDRGRVFVEHAAMLLALAAGGAADWFVAPLSLIGWEEGLPPLVAAAAAFGCAALALDAAGARAGLRKRVLALPDSVAWAGAAVAATLAAAGLALGRLFPDSEDAVTLLRLLRYAGFPAAALAGIGALLAFLDRTATPRALRGLLLFWGALAVIFVAGINQWTMPLYPWALRRYTVCVVPAVSVGLGILLRHLWLAGAGRQRAAGRALAVAAAALLAVTQAGKCAGALLVREHAGAVAALAQVAGQVRDEDVLVADHPSWGTPLRFLFGKNVLDARHFYRRGAETAEAGLAALRRLAREGWRVRFLTSTDKGLAVYPLAPAPVTADWESAPFMDRTVAQHPGARDFRTREQRRVFRLYTLGGDR